MKSSPDCFPGVRRVRVNWPFPVMVCSPAEQEAERGFCIIPVDDDDDEAVVTPLLLFLLSPRSIMLLLLPQLMRCNPPPPTLSLPRLWRMTTNR